MPRPPHVRPLPPRLALFVAAALAGLVGLCGPVPVASGQVLHEHVPVSAGGKLHCASGTCFAGGPTNDLPKAIVGNDGEVRPRPSLGSGTPTPGPGEQVFTPQSSEPNIVGGPGAGASAGDQLNDRPDRRDVIRTDRETGPEPPGTRYYHMVFEPEPYPYKRMTALDDVRLQVGNCADGSTGCLEEMLAVYDIHKQEVPVEGAARQCGGRGQRACGDLFWGSVIVQLAPGAWVPLPSVAPDVRLLAARAEPPTGLEFAADGAGNMFVRGADAGRHRLVWLTEAPASYFGGPLPSGVKLGDEPAALVRRLPPLVQARAQTVLQKIGVKPRRSAPLQSVLDPLVDYFRAFELGELPPATRGSPYLDLAFAQRGVCRHRSYAFTITAIAAGIPARYVENEVHVFVEVYVPRLGWRRINLGGAPLDEALAGAEGHTLYGERGGDPFPQPKPFRETPGAPPKGIEKTRGTMASGGGSSGTATGSGGGNGSGPGSGNGSGGGNGNGSGNGSSNGNGSGGGAVSEGPESSGGTRGLDLESMEREDAKVETRGRRVGTVVQVEVATAVPRERVVRGDRVTVRGMVRAGSGPAANLAVELYLDGPGGAFRVGSAVTDASGAYRTEIEVPTQLPPGRHRVVARTPGDETRLPSSSR